MANSTPFHGESVSGTLQESGCPRGVGQGGYPARLIRSELSCPPPVLDLTDFKRDLSELTDRLGHAQDCL